MVVVMVEEPEVTVARRAEVVIAEELAEELAAELAAADPDPEVTVVTLVAVTKVVAVPEVAEARAAEQ